MTDHSTPAQTGRFGVGSPEVTLTCIPVDSLNYAVKIGFLPTGSAISSQFSKLGARWALEDIRRQADELLKEHFPEHREQPYGKHEAGRPEDGASE